MEEWRGIERPPLAAPFPMHARDETVFLGLGERLLIYRLGTDAPEEVAVGRGIVSVCGSAPGSRPRVALGFDEGGLLFWGDVYYRGLAQPFATGMAFPVLGFTAGGDLVAADGDGCEVYATQDRRLRLKGELHGGRRAPLAVLPLPQPDQFALFTPDGEVAVYQVPPG
jgi:hypothetical protein